jgi:ABC-type Na+ efflux pump permease subunit
MTLWQAAFGWTRPATLGDLAYFGTLAFRVLAFLQLLLVLFFSGMFAASSITTEKDRRTFVLLLMTDLTNREIVLGKLLGSQLEIFAMIGLSLPVLALTMLLGGVDGRQVFLMFLILSAVGLASGSLGLLMALWRDKTFQTLALTVLVMVLYLVAVEGLGLVGYFADSYLGAWSSGGPAWGNIIADWQVRLSPYRAWLSVVEPASDASLDSGLAYQFAGMMLFLTVGLNLIGIWKMRVWNPSGEPIVQREPLSPEEDPEKGLLNSSPARRNVHAAPGPVREVGPNPILWREVATRGYGRKPLLIKSAFLLVFSLILLWVVSEKPQSGYRDYLFPIWGLVPVTVLSLLLVNAQAVTAVTSERDLNSLELLLVTDITPPEFVLGKLGGILWNTKELILPPLLMACLYSFWGYYTIESLIYVLLGIMILTAFSAVLGLHIGLRTEKTRLAIAYSLGTIFFLFVGTLICVYIIAVSGTFGAQWTSFILFLVIGIGGLTVVLTGNKPSAALYLASGVCPPAIFYMVLSTLIGDPRTGKAGDPLWPFLVVASAFGFAIAAMLVPMVSEFDVALSSSIPAKEE